MKKFRNFLTFKRKSTNENISALFVDTKIISPRSEIDIKVVDFDQDLWARTVVEEYGDTLVALGKE